MKINFSEEFPQLAQAPIVEAVIDFRAKPSVVCDPAGFETYFKTEFKDFPHIQIQNQLNYHLSAGTGDSPEPTHAIKSWRGFVFHSADKLRVVQCQKDGFSFSRLPPYNEWHPFSKEALSLWRTYAQLTKPFEIQRLGVRFINRIAIKPEWPSLGHYLIDAPKSLADMGLPLVNFLHGNSFLVPDYKYRVDLNVALQPPDGANPIPAIIVDADVSTTDTMNLKESNLESKLTEMRWLKNKFFFASLTPELIESLR